ncbi:MAG: cupin domain-containing protein [Pseudomonadota bacterium]|nr:cupin domain-containing protein [Burkholderiaceae bacterium]MDQ3188273.1 cupin domain-containing protein [Pseudomonadota bacterium]
MSLREKLIRNINDVDWQPSGRDGLYAGVKSASVTGKRVAGMVARKLGASIDIVPPGKLTCPYHSHYREEEMFIILEGEGSLRVAGEMIAVRAGDIIDIPPGPEYPHQLINTSDAPMKYLSISTQEDPEICEYPDSGKYGIYTSVAGPLLQKRRLHRPDSALDYWDGEP